MRRRDWIGLAAAALPGLAAPAADAEALEVTLLKTGLFLVAGGGCNTLLRFSAAGQILVDAKRAGTYRALRTSARRVVRMADLPVSALLLTGSRPDLAGNAPEFLRAGVPLVAARPALARLGLDAGDRPVVAYEREHRLRLGGVEVRLAHTGRACADDGALALFADLRVIALGDLVAAGAPRPDYARGGSLLGWQAALAQGLAADFDVAIAAQGPPLSRADVAAYAAKLDTMVGRARRLARSGVAPAEFAARLRLDDLGWRLGLEGDDLAQLAAELV